MQMSAATSLLGAHVLLRNGKEGEVVFVGQSLQGFGLQFSLLQADGTLQEAHSGDVASVRLAAQDDAPTERRPAEVRRKPATTP